MALRRLREVSDSSGSASWRMISCSAAEEFRQISTIPTAPKITDQATLPSQLTPSALNTKYKTISTEPSAMAWAMPVLSVRARLMIVVSSPARGKMAQAIR